MSLKLDSFTKIHIISKQNAISLALHIMGDWQMSIYTRSSEMKA